MDSIDLRRIALAAYDILLEQNKIITSYSDMTRAMLKSLASGVPPTHANLLEWQKDASEILQHQLGIDAKTDVISREILHLHPDSGRKSN